MNLLLFLLIAGAFVYLACNLGADRRPGHASYGLRPVGIILIVVVLGLLLWLLVGPVVVHVFTALGLK